MKQTILRSVIFAAAILGATACSKKPAPQAPTNTATDPKGTDPMMTGDKKPDPAPMPGGEDPCAPPAK